MPEPIRRPRGATIHALPIRRPTTRRRRAVAHLRENRWRWYVTTTCTLTLLSQFGIDGRLHALIWGS